MDNPHLIIYNIVNNWSEEEVEDFLVNMMPRMKFEIDSTNYDGYTALAALVDKNWYSERSRNVMTLLLKHGSDPLQKMRGYAIIVILADKEETSLFIEFLRYVKDINSTLNDYRITPLHLAIDCELKVALKYIIRRKANINKPDSLGQTPLHHAVKVINCLTMTKILLKKFADLEVKDHRGRTPFLLAAENNNLEIVELILSYNPNLFVLDVEQNNALHLLFKFEGKLNLKLCDLLLNKKCDPNATNFQNLTPLHYLVMNDRKEKIECAQKLLNYGANLNIQSVEGDTVLHKVASHCLEPYEFIKFLLKNGADPNLVNNHNKTFFDLLKDNHHRDALKTVQLISYREKLEKLHISTELLRAINSDEDISRYYKSCNEELDTLMSTKIAHQTERTIFTMFNSNVRELAKLCYEEMFRLAIYNFVADDYPIYGQKIEGKFKKALELRKTELACFNILDEIFDDAVHSNQILDIVSPASDDIRDFRCSKFAT